MKPEIKEQWIEALTSGEYEQGYSALRTHDDKYCCLGVLCDLAVKSGIAKWEQLDGDWAIVHIAKDINDTADFGVGLLPKFMRNWSGVENDDGAVSMATGRYSLTALNDIHKDTFARIAEIIEGNL